MSSIIREFGTIHDDVCFAVYDWLLDGQPANAASAAYRASIVVPALHVVYLVTLSVLIQPDASRHFKTVWPAFAAFGVLYGMWCEKVIARRGKTWKVEFELDPGAREDWRWRWRLAVLAYAVCGAVSFVLTVVFVWASTDGTGSLK